MEPLEAEVEALALVCLGSFTPRLAQPSWLARHDLIAEAEADNAEVTVVSNEFTVFKTEWFTLEMLPERFQVQTSLSAYYMSLTDLVVGLLRILPEASVGAFGINHHGHFKLPNKRLYHALGHRLAPKDLWSNLLKDPGTRKVVIQGERTDGNAGYIWLTVEPSQLVEHGVYLHCNDHYIPTHGVASTAELAADMISESRRQSFERARDFFAKVLEYAREADLKG
jgi:hypothetical protein